MPQPATPTEPECDYPQSDGKPMADNTLQLRWIIKLVGNLENLFRDRADVFAAGNQNWYPVRYDKDVVQAPDAYVVFGRPKGHRPSWNQWQENDVPMTVVFEVLSPSNTPEETAGKVLFYEQYGVQECYVFDPETNDLQAYLRGKTGVALVPVHPGPDFVSPLLGIRFDRTGAEMVVRYPDGRPFLTLEELDRLREAAQQRAEDEHKRAEDEHKRANEAEKRALEGLLDGLEALLEAKFQQQGLALMTELRKVQDAGRLAEILRAVRKAATVADVPTS